MTSRVTVCTVLPAPVEAASLQAAAAGAAKARNSFLFTADLLVDAGLGAAGAALSALRKASVAKASGSRPAPPKSAYPKELAFLDDRKMSVQEKVFRLLLHLQQKSDREVEKKMQDYLAAARKAKEEAKEGGGASAFGKLLSAVRDVIPGADTLLDLLESEMGRKLFAQLSGPVFAGAVTALGLPHLAPAAAALGPELFSRLHAAASEGGTAKPAAAGDKTGYTGPREEAADEKALATELQWMLEKQRAMTSLLSNAMKAMHDTSMSVIQNVR